MWKCPKCGRSFKNENQSHYCGRAPESVEEYILAQDVNVRSCLQRVRETLISSLPDATEKISWSMPTYWKGYNIIHFAANKNHIGLYPGPEAVAFFTEKLDKGLLDFGVLCEKPNPAKYEYIKFPESDIWGVVMPSDDPLSKKDSITFDDLLGLSIFASEQSFRYDLPMWCGDRINELSLEGTFRLSYNASMFVKEGLGYLLTFKDLINTAPESGLSFRPLEPELKVDFFLIWNKEQTFTPIAERFLEHMKTFFDSLR